MNLTDDVLVEMAQQGEKRAFDLLVRRYQGRIRYLIARFIRNHADIDEVAQEVFIKAYLGIEGFRGDSAFYSWLYRIAVNTANNYLSNRHNTMFRQSHSFDDEDAGDLLNSQVQDLDTPESNFINKELTEQAIAAYEELSAEMQLAVTMREKDNLSYEEIAEIMDCPVGTVRSRIFRAREAIVRRLTRNPGKATQSQINN